MILIIVLAVLFLDQLSKILITQNLSYNQSLPVIKGLFYITLVHNRGAAFGILKNQVPLFIATSVFAIILIALSLRGAKQNRLYTVSLSLILAGALGNLIDRVCLGYVIDFFDFRVWPVFNVADSAITVGVILLGWSVLITQKIKSQCRNP